MAEPQESVVDSFLADLPERSRLELELGEFVLGHASHHRPIALVTSGGTAADLEENSVRCLDNFSTGLRGAASVEEFLNRGYAVVHLSRMGSAAPFARVLGELLGLAQANHGLSVDAMGKLFAVAGEELEEEDLVQQVLDHETDPWLTESNEVQVSYSPGAVALQRQLLHSTRLQKALLERSLAMKEGRLFTISFRTIEEYLAKLKLAAVALNDCQSLALIYLAAAVSDYYIPKEEKSQHKIPSSTTGITLQLRPVPKTMGLLRRKWAPQSFLVGFKLETDIAILRKKAENAVLNYGCHMVIGNMLHTRHTKVWILSPLEWQSQDVPLQDWSFQEVAKPPSSVDPDALESAIMDVVVQSHFDFISRHGYVDQEEGMRSASQRRAQLQDQKRQLQRKAFREQIQQHAWAIAGTVIAIVLSSSINAVLQQRATRR